MQKRAFVHITGIATIIIYFIWGLRHVLSLLTTDLRPFVLSQHDLVSEILHEHSSPELIPRIVHQVYLGFDELEVPATWRKARQTCVDWNPDYEHIVRVSPHLGRQN